MSSRDSNCKPGVTDMPVYRNAYKLPTLVGLLALLLALLGVQPNPEVDYLAQANAALLPDNPDPNLNAASDYIAIFQAFLPLPESPSDQWDAWPGDMDPNQLAILEEWTQTNSDVDQRHIVTMQEFIQSQIPAPDCASIS